MRKVFMRDMTSIWAESKLWHYGLRLSPLRSVEGRILHAVQGGNGKSSPLARAPKRGTGTRGSTGSSKKTDDEKRKKA